VKFGNDKEVEVMGEGFLSIKTKQGKKTYINDVLHVPKLKHNLLSVGQIMDKS
jgi:hypothetical protein